MGMMKHAAALVFAMIAGCLAQKSLIELTVSPQSSSEYNPTNATVTCKLDQIKPSDVLLMKISKTEPEQPLATVTSNHSAIFYGKPSDNIHVSGGIDGSLGQPPYLTLTLVNPTSDMAGSYKCDAVYLDAVGVINTAWETSELTITKFDIKSILGEFKSFQNRISDLEQALTNKDDTLQKKQVEISDALSKRIYEQDIKINNITEELKTKDVIIGKLLLSEKFQNNQLAALEPKGKECLNKINNLDSVVDGKDSMIQSLEAKLNQTIVTSSNQLGEHGKLLDNLHLEMAKKESTINNLLDKETSLDKRVATIEEKMEELKNATDVLQNELAIKDATIKSLQSTLDQVSEKILQEAQERKIDGNKITKDFINEYRIIKDLISKLQAKHMADVQQLAQSIEKTISQIATTKGDLTKTIINSINAQNKRISNVDTKYNTEVRGMKTVIGQLARRIADVVKSVSASSSKPTKRSCQDKTWTLGSNGICYKVFNKKKYSWARAKLHCKGAKSNLAKIRNQKEYDIVNSLLKDRKTSYWFGLNDLKREGRWVFDDGEPIAKFTKWKKGEPNGHRRESCAIIYGDSLLWNDQTCNTKVSPICQRDSVLVK